MDQNNYNPTPMGGMPGGPPPGKSAATGSLVCGILSLVLYFPSLIPMVGIPFSVIGIILAIVGLVMSSNAKRQGSPATAGLVLSIIGLALCALALIWCGLCTTCMSCGSCGSLGALGSFF